MDRDRLINSLEDMRAEILQDFGVDLLGLVGSQAREDATEKSDVDIAYKRSDGRVVTLIHISAATRRLSEALNTSIDLIDWPSVRPHYKNVMKKDLIPFHG